MPTLASSPLRLFQRLFRAGAPDTYQDAGLETVLDGATAVAVTEACLGEAAAISRSFLADSATVAWRAEEARRLHNCFGAPLASHGVEGPRGVVATAMGLAMSGIRATAFLSGPDLMRAEDLLVMAAGRRLPLVVHLTNRTPAAHAGALGSGHEGYQASADSGCFVLMAANVQEAVDLTLVARRVTELSLLPGIVAMDDEHTAQAVQDVTLASPKLVREILGAPNDRIPPPTAAQRLLFGGSRRRLPRWHDLDRPVLHGALQGPETWGLSAVGKHPYFDRHVAPLLEESFALLGERTGRPLGSLSTHRLEDADVVLIAQGSAVETLEALADHVRREQGIAVGVIGILCLRPLPGPRIAEVLRNKRVVAVLERADTPLAADPPLTRQLRAALDRASENGRFGPKTHPHYPVMDARERPRLRSVIYGLGGLALRGADVVALVEELAAMAQSASALLRWPRRWFGAGKQGGHHARSPIYLGFDFDRPTSIYPKRQVLLDVLRRDYPEIGDLGLRGDDTSPDIRPEGALTVAVHRVTGQGAEGLAPEAAAFLQQLVGGRVRSDPGQFWERFESYCVDRFTLAAGTLRDPGDQVPVDLSLLTAPRYHQFIRPIADLVPGGILLIPSVLTGESLWSSLPARLREGVRIRQGAFYGMPALSPAYGLELSKEHLLGGLLGSLLDAGRLDASLQQVLASRAASLQNLPAAETESRMAAFKAGLEGVARVDYTDFQSSATEDDTDWEDRAPAAVRHLGRAFDAYDSLPRFWHQVGVLYRDGDADELTPDPYLATGAVPPLTATFRDMSDSRDGLPVFEPAFCTGCGRCWSQCPDSAIAPIVATPTALIQAGIQIASAAALRPIAAPLATQIKSLCANGEWQGGTFGEVTASAFDAIGPGGSMSPARARSIAEAHRALVEAMGALPVARTAPFFDGAAGEAELLSVLVNPDACKDCGVCIRACEAGALSRATQSAERLRAARDLWRLWERLPDAPAATVERALAHPDVGPVAGVMLLRHCLRALAGGDGAEAGSGEKIAVRFMLGCMEYEQRNRTGRFLADIEATRQSLLGTIRDTLTDALPTDDLEALGAGLSAVHPGQVRLAELTERVEEVAADSGVVDAARLHALVQTARALGDLQWELTRGRQGLGRAHFGLAIAPGSVATWAGAYPHNPFHVPVAVDTTGDTAQLAAGLLEGQLREATEGLALLRRARAALDSGKTKGSSTGNGAALTWRSLGVEEQRTCPPVVVIGNNDTLGGMGLASVMWLLGSDLPFKVLVLSDVQLGLDALSVSVGGPRGVAETPLSLAKTPKVNLGLMALAQRRAYVAQTSISEPAHFHACVEGALRYTGPAVVRVHAPSPERHGFRATYTVDRARGAVQSRAFPLFRYDPEAEGVLGTRLNLDGNPSPEALWTEVDGEAFTAAHWALEEGRFYGQFTALEEDAPAPVPLAEYLELAPRQRQGKTPFVTWHGSGAEPERYRVAPALVEATAARAEGWRTLQELAGVVTPFTDAVERRAEARLAKAHERELAEIRQACEAQAATQQEENTAEMAARVHAQLMRLAGLSVDGAQ